MSGARDAVSTAEHRRREALRLLADGDLHSGAALAARLGVTRAAVWKLLRAAAEDLSLEIESVRGKGYRLREPLELLEADAIEAALPHEVRARLADIEVLDSVASTNARLMALAREGAPSGLVCLAERQLAGRGRAGRSWVSPFGSNLYLSMLWRYGQAPVQLGGLSLACGVRAADALARAGVQDIGLKWPNDLHWRRRKLGGLLLEVAGESQGPSQVVAGIGVNRRLSPAQAAGIDQPWVDLTEILGERAPGRNALAAAMIEALVRALTGYGEQGLAPFLTDWARFDAYLGQPVEVIAGDYRLRGTAAGVGADGALLLDTDGGRRSLHAGEVSLRPARAGDAGR
jgi:BirA family biotin operon repressor/biotin-[acetyl-CoA-carboxylase] ligase